MEAAAAPRKADLVMLDVRPMSGVLDRCCVRAPEFLRRMARSGCGRSGAGAIP